MTQDQATSKAITFNYRMLARFCQKAAMGDATASDAEMALVSLEQVAILTGTLGECAEAVRDIERAGVIKAPWCAKKKGARS